MSIFPFRIAAGVIAGAFLAGCCSDVTTDPRQGGLAGGVCGKATGAYEQRISLLQSKANSLETANSQLSARLSSSHRQSTALDSEIRNKRSQLAQIRNDLSTLMKKADEKNRLQGEIAALMAEAGQRENRIIAIESGMRSAQNERLRDDARQQAEGLPVDDLLKRIRQLRAELTTP